MSYGVHAYVVDTRSLISLIGSDDRTFVGAMTKNARENIAALNEEFELEIEEGEFLPLEDAVGELVSGRFSSDDMNPAQYGYALEIICGSMGVQIGPDHFTQLSVSYLNDIPVLGHVIYDAGPLEGLIPMPDDFPGIGFVANDQVDTRLADIRGAMQANEDDDAAVLYREYASWLESAKASRRGLVTFMY